MSKEPYKKSPIALKRDHPMMKMENNPAMKKIIAVMQCVINCCMWCIEKIIGYLNKNAYIMAATHGHGFCTGMSKKALQKSPITLKRDLMTYVYLRRPQGLHAAHA